MIWDYLKLTRRVSKGDRKSFPRLRFGLAYKPVFKAYAGFHEKSIHTKSSIILLAWLFLESQISSQSQYEMPEWWSLARNQ